MLFIQKIYFLFLSFTFSYFLIIFFPFCCHAEFSFALLADQGTTANPEVVNKYDYFSGALAALKVRGAGSFVISPGDMDTPVYTDQSIENILGPDYHWFPVVGNHDLPGGGFEPYPGFNMEWLRQYHYDSNGIGVQPDIENTGPSGCPETTYSFDYDNVHFVVLNVYCSLESDGQTDGDIPLHLYDWLENDLASTVKEHIFVIGHEPAFPLPDVDNKRERHMIDSLNAHPTNRDRFWFLLERSGVVAYFCGHTHNFSAEQINGVWQVSVGHSRGAGDLGAPSTFLKVYVNKRKITYEVYRDVHDGVYDYNDIFHEGTLKVSLPVITGAQLLLLEGY